MRDGVAPADLLPDFVDRPYRELGTREDSAFGAPALQVARPGSALVRWLAAFGLTAAIGAFATGPAAAAALPPMDLEGVNGATQLAIPAVGFDRAFGRFVFGGTGFAFGIPGLASISGAAGHVGWRFIDARQRGYDAGLSVVSGYIHAGGSWSTSNETWFLQPVLAVAVPLGTHVRFRVAGGPAFYVHQDSPGVFGTASRTQSFVPFVPNLELAIRVADDAELSIGGLPELVGWRRTF